MWQPQTQSQMLNAHVTCLQTSKVSALHLSASEYWNISDESSITSIRSYVYCLLSALGYFDDKNGFNVDRIMDQVKLIPYLKNTAFQRSVFEKCADKNESNDLADVWAFRGFRCLMDEIKKEQTAKHTKTVLL